MPVKRLKTRPQFQAVLSGKTLARTDHFALHCAPLVAALVQETGGVTPPLFPDVAVWMGAMVPKRWARRAVTRSTIKRQIYQVSAQYEPFLSASAHLVRLRSVFDRKVFVSATSDVLKDAVRTELQQLFERAKGVRSGALPAIAGT